MNDKNENILLKIRHKNIDNKSNDNCLKKYNDESIIDKQLETPIVLNLDNVFANTTNDNINKEVTDNVFANTTNDNINKEVTDNVLVNDDNKNISEEIVHNVLVNNIDNENIRNVTDNVIANTNSESSNKEIVENDNKAIYSTLSNELTYFSEKINKILLDTQNMQDTLKNKNKFEKFVFEIRQNHIGDDEFYINNELTSEDYFMKKLLSYKK